eukprot:6666898-Prymnesium_polylepis.1
MELNSGRRVRGWTVLGQRSRRAPFAGAAFAAIARKKSGRLQSAAGTESSQCAGIFPRRRGCDV